jgi:ubiquinol-cytochrome c reductase cytochrome c subunit
MKAWAGIVIVAGLLAAGAVVRPPFGRAQAPPAAPPMLPFSGPSPATPAGDVHRGYTLYAVHCASCHGTAGEGTADGIPLAGIGAAAVDFVLRTGRMPLTDPRQPMYRRPSSWTEQQVADVVAYVTSLGPGGPAIPAVDPARGDLAYGRKIFADNCEPCHGAAAQGATVGGGVEAPPLHQATALEIAEAVRVGPDPMPRFDTGLISQYDLDSVVQYVIWLRHPPDPGGFDLGHVGPVAEGFVAWAVGLAAVVVILRFIGTTS